MDQYERHSAGEHSSQRENERTRHNAPSALVLVQRLNHRTCIAKISSWGDRLGCAHVCSWDTREQLRVSKVMTIQNLMCHHQHTIVHNKTIRHNACLSTCMRSTHILPGSFPRPKSLEPRKHRDRHLLHSHSPVRRVHFFHCSARLPRPHHRQTQRVPLLRLLDQCLGSGRSAAALAAFASTWPLPIRDQNR